MAGTKLSESREPAQSQAAWVDGHLSKLRQATFQTLVMQALQLRRVHREVFILCEIKGYDISEAAAILGVRESAAARRLRQAHAQMLRLQSQASAD